MNIDLRELMLDRSTAGPAVRMDRAAEVRRRIDRVRRRRAAGVITATCAAVAAVAVGAALLPGHPTSLPDPAASATTTNLNGFPEYADGARVIATATASRPQTEVSVTIEPETLDLVLVSRCDPPLQIEMRLNHRFLYAESCVASPYPGFALQDLPSVLTEGVVVGQPVTFTMTVTHQPQWYSDRTTEWPELPDTGAIAFAVMQRVPFEEYPLPPRPATLVPLTDDAAAAAVLELRSDPEDPQHEVSGTFAWWSGAALRIRSQTPGRLQVSIGGVPVAIHETWDYDADVQDVLLEYVDQLHVDEGTAVTITVDAVHVTGAWAVWVIPAAEVPG